MRQHDTHGRGNQNFVQGILELDLSNAGIANTGHWSGFGVKDKYGKTWMLRQRSSVLTLKGLTTI